MCQAAALLFSIALFDLHVLRRVHRLLHVPKFYKAYHIVHHQYDPPFRCTHAVHSHCKSHFPLRWAGVLNGCSLAGEIQHPVEFAFNIIVPLMAGPILMAAISGVHSKRFTLVTAVSF